MGDMLRIDNINVFYDAIHAIKNVSIAVGEGEIVTLIGANGAGKSTILMTVSGLLRSKEGAISFMGERIDGMQPHKIVERGLTHVPEGRRVFMQMTVRDNLEMGAFVRSEGHEEALERVYRHFPRLKERSKQMAGTLSGGEQQMLAIGRALMINPKLLMMDEPSMGLAPVLVERIFEIITDLHNEGTTILLVEQNARLALSVADRAYVLETGTIALSGTGEELYKSDEIRKAYLGDR